MSSLMVRKVQHGTALLAETLVHSWHSMSATPSWEGLKLILWQWNEAFHLLLPWARRYPALQNTVRILQLTDSSYSKGGICSNKSTQASEGRLTPTSDSLNLTVDVLLHTHACERSLFGTWEVWPMRCTITDPPSIMSCSDVRPFELSIEFVAMFESMSM